MASDRIMDGKLLGKVLSPLVSKWITLMSLRYSFDSLSGYIWENKRVVGEVYEERIAKRSL